MAFEATTPAEMDVHAAEAIEEDSKQAAADSLERRPRAETAAPNPEGGSDEVRGEWKACLAAARSPATEEDLRAWRCE